MYPIIITLFFSGMLSGLIQYFVDFKKLPINNDDEETASFITENTPGWWEQFWTYVTLHWQFFAYIVIGAAGAFLVPMLSNYMSLSGVNELKAYTKCLGGAKPGDCRLDEWFLLVLFGYGIVFGYSAVRIIRSFGFFILGNISKQTKDLKKAIESAAQNIQQAANKIQKANVTQGASLEGTVMDTAAFDPGLELFGTVEHTAFKSVSEPLMEEALEAEAAPGNLEVENPLPWTGKPWRTAESLRKLLMQVNQLAPGRNKASDGTIGDAIHATRNSDHNPWILNAGVGVVTALDITHDPANGCDCNVLVKALQEHMDPRVKYVIWNRKIMSSSVIRGVAAWTWRPYSGKNPHDKHVHISVKPEASLYDDVSLWQIDVSA